MSLSNTKSNNGISANSELDLKAIRLTGSLTANSISTPFINTPYLQTQKIDLFGTSVITLGDTLNDGAIQGFTNKNLNINADNNLIIGAGADTFLSSDTIYLRSGGVDKLIIGNVSSTFTNEVDFNNTVAINNVVIGNALRVPGTAFDYLNVSDGQLLCAPDGISPKFGVFPGFSAFAGDLTLFNASLTNTNYSFNNTNALINKPLVFVSLTTAQRNALAGVVNGMVIYNTTTAKLECYGAGIWNPLF